MQTSISRAAFFISYLEKNIILRTRRFWQPTEVISMVSVIDNSFFYRFVHLLAA